MKKHIQFAMGFRDDAMKLSGDEAASYQEETAAIALRFAFVGRGICRMANAATAVNIARIALV